jgi:hypothetical protein
MEAFADLEIEVFRSYLEGYKATLGSGMGDGAWAHLLEPPFKPGIPEEDLPDPRTQGVQLYERAQTFSGRPTRMLQIVSSPAGWTSMALVGPANE